VEKPALSQWSLRTFKTNTLHKYFQGFEF